MSRPARAGMGAIAGRAAATGLPHRGVLVALLAALLVACGSDGSSQTTAQATREQPAPTPGSERTFSVRGKEITVECLGAGAPTIVLEAGQALTGRSMRRLQEQLAPRARTCSYDRARIRGRRAGRDIIADLHALLAAAKLPPPIVLVGHSAGGLLVQLYARTYPEEVVGVVSMNPIPPAEPWFRAVTGLFSATELAVEREFYAGNNDESIDYGTTSAQLGRAAAPPAVPFELMLSTKGPACEGVEICLKSYAAYERIMRDVAATWPEGRVSQIAAGHEIYQTDAAAIVATMERMLRS